MNDTTGIAPAVTKREDRKLTEADARLLFAELASALYQDCPETVGECESMVQQLLYIIEQNNTNGRRIAEEVRRWRNEMPTNFSEKFFQIRRDIQDTVGANTELGLTLHQQFNLIYQQFKLLHGEIGSFYYPSRYTLTYFKNGIPQANNPLRLMQVMEAKDGTINLHLNHSDRR